MPCAREEMVLVASPRNRKLARRRTIRAAELEGLRMILFNTGTATRALIDDYFRRVGIQPEVAMESESVATINRLFASTWASALCRWPRWLRRPSAASSIYLRLSDERFTRDIGIVFHKSSYQPKPLVELIISSKAMRR